MFDLDGTLLNRDESVKMFIQSQYIKFNKMLRHIPKEIYITRIFRIRKSWVCMEG